MSARVCVVTLVLGRDVYYRSARESIASVLAKTPFDLCVVSDRDVEGLPAAGGRVMRRILSAAVRDDCRAAPFLKKFEAIQLALSATPAAVLVLLDADALFVRATCEADVTSALGDAELAMVEQPTVTGSGMTRADFFDHYRNHTLAWFGEDPRAMLDPEAFRFFNSGVVAGRRAAFEALADWASTTIAGRDTLHRVGKHMIADQDYIQYWCHRIRSGGCAALSWDWNHCEHWDDGFPRPGARIAHFSNFCHGPSRVQVRRMRILGRRGRLDGLEGRLLGWISRIGRG